MEGRLRAETPNAIRKLFQLNRVDTIAALMHEAVLVPEGRIDWDWLRLLGRAVDTVQHWAGQQQCRFGTSIGVVQTQDAAVATTFAALRTVHPSVAVLVDGDDEGRGYAQALLAQVHRPIAVLRWPNDWTMEDVVGWIVEAGGAHVLEDIGRSIDPAPVAVGALVDRLKSRDRQRHGLKQDHVAYEAIAQAIADSADSRQRANELLDAICEITRGQDHPRFVRAAPDVAEFVFHP